MSVARAWLRPVLRAIPSAASIAVAAFCVACSGDATPPNIVLISIDTLRADHLDVYGYSRPTAPNLSRLAEEGVLFEHALSQAPWTLPAMASVLTGLYPSQHGASTSEARIAGRVETLAEALLARGYRTRAVVSHSFVDANHGFARGFERFDESQVLGHDAVTSEAVSRIALEKMLPDAGQPFFLWVHYFDPHFTYVHHPEVGFAGRSEGRFGSAIPARLLSRPGRVSDSELEHIRAVYDEEIRVTDWAVGALLDGIEALGLKENTVVLVTGDHGEYFLERGRFFHGKDVYEELVHVPLIIGGDLPEALRGTVVERSVETASIPATVTWQPRRAPSFASACRS